MLLPFEASFGDIEANLDDYVAGIVDSLRSEFMTMPKGPGFIEYAVFEDGYEALKRVTRDFRILNPADVFQLVKMCRLPSLCCERCWDSRRQNGPMLPANERGPASRRMPPVRLIAKSE